MIIALAGLALVCRGADNRRGRRTAALRGGIGGLARYLINVPAGWNGGLVNASAHGYQGEGSGVRFRREGSAVPYRPKVRP